ncbi:MAG: methyltransferase domain-containing protein, partial [Rhodocyclaceae bacterium]
HGMTPDSLPFDDGAFDAVVLDNVLEHIDRPEALLAEIRRVLEPDGRLLAGVPGRKGFALDPDHKVHYDEATLLRLLEHNGFACERVFHMPFRCPALEGRMRQYCRYGLFRPREA